MKRTLLNGGKVKKAPTSPKRRWFLKGAGSILNIWPRPRSADEIMRDLERDLREDPRLH